LRLFFGQRADAPDLLKMDYSVPGSERVVRLAAMGDMMLARGVASRFRTKPEAFTMAEISSVLGTHDLVFANLECPVSVSGRPDPIQDPHVTFRAHPDALAILKGLGVTVVSLANNHMLDYGPDALGATIENLDRAGIRHAGAGRDYAEANTPVCLDIHGVRVAILAHVFIYSASTRMARGRRAGVSDHRPAAIGAQIRALRRAGYVVIVSLHWGLEYSFFPVPYQMRQARRLVEYGASLILGHGPHYPQGMEAYRSGRIVYSLGNFVFDEPQPYANRGYIYSASIDSNRSLAGETLFPFRIVDCVPRLSTGLEHDRLIRAIDGLGRGYHRKRPPFWRRISNRYCSDLINRVVRSRSARFLSLVPLSFFWDVGLANLLRKLTLANLRTLVRAL
jgi:poly-gamma-glutamate capsule biosynthesis protein CapA/YwtB (metallophosphatase superfamily)